MEFPCHNSRMSSHSAGHYTPLKLSRKVLEGEMLVLYTLFGVCVCQRRVRGRERKRALRCVRGGQRTALSGQFPSFRFYADSELGHQTCIDKSSIP